MREQEAVHVVEGDSGQRIALSRLLRSIGYSTYLYASAEEFLGTTAPEGAGCVMTEVRLPGCSGIALQQHLRAQARPLPLIVATAFGDIKMSVQCMKAGAIDFLTKPLRDQEVIDAVEAALKADRNRRAAASEMNLLQTRLASLSTRERQVMALVTSGKPNRQVADLLELSEITVKIYRGTATRKMAARSFAELAVMAHRLKLHEPQARVTADHLAPLADGSVDDLPVNLFNSADVSVGFCRVKAQRANVIES